jgi:hypothetical protein
MASVPKPVVNTGDFVYTENKLCYVENISNNLGYNQYTVVEIDTGERMLKTRYQLEMPEIKLLMSENFEAEDMTAKQAETEEKGRKRFLDVTESELDDFALNRNSKRTRIQTTWGVSVFKGKKEIQKKSKQTMADSRHLESLRK